MSWYITIIFCTYISDISLYTNQISKVGFTDQLWIYSDDFSLEIELISHQNETKIHLQNELCKFYLYLNKYNLKMTIIRIVYVFFFSQRCKICKNAFWNKIIRTSQILLSFESLLFEFEWKRNLSNKNKCNGFNIQSKIESSNSSQHVSSPYILRIIKQCR